MARLLTPEEFEYQTMCGSTAPAFVLGVGLVQFDSTYTLSTRPNPMGNLYAGNGYNNAVYLTPKAEMYIDSDSEAYRNALANEIKNTITDGKSLWNPVSGEIMPLNWNTSVDVSVDRNENVKISVGNGANSNTTTLSLDHLMGFFRYPTFCESRGLPAKVFDSQKKEMPNVAKSDQRYFAEKARSVSSFLLSVRKPFLAAEEKLKLYTKTVAPCGTKRIFPPDLKYPNWTPWGVGGKTVIPRIGLDVSNSTIMSASKYLKWAGRGIGFVGIALVGFDISQNGFNWSNGLHIAMAGVALIPELSIIASIYFAVDLGLTLKTDKGIGDRVDDYMRGRPALEQAHIAIQFSGVFGIIPLLATEAINYINK